MSFCHFSNYLFFGFVILMVFSCKDSDNQDVEPLFVPVSSAHSGVNFANVLFENEDLNIITFEYFYNGAGVGIGDFNQDGLQDIFFSANMMESKLYLNKGDFVFEDITQKAGISTQDKWATGVSVVDINQDGWMDIYVCYAGPYLEPGQRANELYINQKNNTFKEQSKAYGLADTGHSTQAAFFDYDLDGDLDMYLLTNITDQTGPNIIRPKRLEGQMPNTDRLYRNNGENEQGQITFSNISKEAGMLIEGYGLGVAIRDMNDDGWPDIYVTNDYLSNDIFYINNQDGTFSNQADNYLQHQSYSAMGNDIADYNNDGLQDIVALDMLPPDNLRKKLMFGATNYNRYQAELRTGYEPQFMRNTLQLNNGANPEGNLSFSEIGQLANIHETDWSWAPLLADFDLDGWKDLMVTNGYPKDITNRDFANYKMQEFMNAQYDRKMKNAFVKAINSLEGAHIPNYIFQNQGNLTFKDQSQEWGFTIPSYSTGAAYADLDNDGDLDLIINNTEAKAFILKNQAEKQGKHYLKIKLNGPQQNIQGLGAKIYIYHQSKSQFQEYSTYRGFQSTVDPHIFFGLGEYNQVDSLKIIWTDGKQQLIKQIKADQLLTLDYKNANTPLKKVSRQIKTLFTEANQRHKIQFTHQEKEYPDFHTEPLLPHQFSKKGPGIAVGDVNGDQKEDFYIGGAAGQSGRLFVQQKDGAFKPQNILINQESEDQGVLFFDADQDEDLDLYIVSGSNEWQKGDKIYQDKLLFNDGKGNFMHNPKALPNMKSNGSCVNAADYDQDGDLDLFVGGGVSPQHYPQADRSYILENRGGKFIDVTADICKDLINIGMVNSALWTDFDNDNQVDLIVVGEWMPISFFKNIKGKLHHVTDQTSLQNTAGWWNSIQGADFDQDGDIDYILGNLGLNSPHKASTEEPVCLYVNDFNQDNRIDPILCRYIQGKNYPVHPLDDIISQINGLKQTFTSYESYAKSTIQNVFTEQELSQAKLFKAYNFESSYLENLGGGKFKLKALPLEAQFAPAYGIQVDDYNQDGLLDALLIGNSFSTEVLTGNYDASQGLLLRGNGQGDFKAIPNTKTGFFVNQDGKALASLTLSNGKNLLLASQNNATLKVFNTLSEEKTVIPLQSQDAYVDIYLDNDKIIRKEFYYGGGYLSQSSRFVICPQGCRKVKIYDYQGKSYQWMVEK